jgi:hypothetical protein
MVTSFLVTAVMMTLVRLASLGVQTTSPRSHRPDRPKANRATRLKTLSGLAPYEYICKIWTSEPDRFILNPIHQFPGQDT